MSFRFDEGGGLRWRTAAIGAIALVLIAVAVTWTVVAQGDDQNTTAPSPDPSTTPSASPSAPPPEGYESACGLSGGSTQTPSEAPADVNWQRDEGWSFPISGSAGPGDRPADGPWSCFARTPTGALIAAATIDPRINRVDDFEKAVNQQVVAGVGREALLAKGPAPTTNIVDIKGFIIESYTPDDAVVSLYLVQQNQNLTCSAELAWRGGDWKLRAQRDGSTLTGCIRSEPARYIPWGES